MKSILCFFVSAIAFSIPTAAAEKNQVKPMVVREVGITLALPKKEYLRTDEIAVNITLTNKSKQNLFIRRFIGWGESSSVSVWINDRFGKIVSSDFWADELDPPITSVAQLEELKPGASKRVILNVPLADYDLKIGESYTLTVVYHSSISPHTPLSLPLLTAGHPKISSCGSFVIK
ncbi:hypothetical protein [Pseudoduganella sp. GCM10020061]|uniref:hypothetical protein n=1 Tax=Pseudoduganella sp. GCM10020061 TaxID=3317345 RepID=UPI00362BED00